LQIGIWLPKVTDTTTDTLVLYRQIHTNYVKLKFTQLFDKNKLKI